MTVVTGARVDVVVPTIGRPSLDTLLVALAGDRAAPVACLTVVDDRLGPPAGELRRRLDDAGVAVSCRLLTTGGRGPAAARNAGWRSGSAPWVVFLDDDVVPWPGWGAALARDLARAEGGRDVGVVAGRVVVPLPAGRRPTDWERQVAALADPPGWLTADLAIRRAALDQVGGLDERFPRAHREDTDLELRVREAGWRDLEGRRTVLHPVGPAGPWVSVRRQVGNQDDVLMARLHGRRWRSRIGEPPATFPRHAVTVTAGAAAVAAGATGRRALATGAGVLWAALTTCFAWRRVAPGPRDRREVAVMALTSIAIPPVAVAHRVRAWARWARSTARRARWVR